MNSKILFAFVLTGNICIFVTAQVYSYGVFVKTADKEFDSQKGKLKLSVISTDNPFTLFSKRYASNISQEDFLLTPNDIEIKKDEIYATTISSIVPLKNITSVYLRWTLAEPFNPYHAIKKPIIYFYQVTLSLFTPKTYPEGSTCVSYFFRPETLPIGIEHADGAIFNVSGDILTGAFYRENSNITVLNADCYMG